MDDLKKPEVFAAYYEKVYRELYYFALHTLKNPQDGRRERGGDGCVCNSGEAA